jgi:hypothetical protein
MTKELFDLNLNVLLANVAISQGLQVPSCPNLNAIHSAFRDSMNPSGHAGLRNVVPAVPVVPLKNEGIDKPVDALGIGCSEKYFAMKFSVDQSSMFLPWRVSVQLT